VQVRADAPQSAIYDLIRVTDSGTEIQGTLRGGCAFGWSKHESGC